MLITCADDLGRDAISTNTCLNCFAQDLITSASVMVFMADTERAAESAEAVKLETGLHLNLTLPYDAPQVAESVKESQTSVARYLRRGKWAQVVYNPLLRAEVASVFQTQLDEYRRLFHRDPAHFNGHQHMHLCMNMILGRVIPPGSAVRRSFTFRRGEKGVLNRLYRRWIDAWLVRRHVFTDAFFSLDPVNDYPRLERIVGLAITTNVELMVHTWRPDQFEFLRSEEYRSLIAPVRRGTFSVLALRRRNEE